MLKGHLLETRKNRIQKLKKQQRDSQYIHQNELDNFAFNMWYGEFKDLHRRTVSDKEWRDKTLNIAKIAKYDGYQKNLASMGYEFFDKKLLVVLLKMKLYQAKN